MRRTAVFFALVLGGTPTTLWAQVEQAPNPSNVPEAPRQFYVQDGGVRERLQSIVVPPKLDAPFTLTLQTEWSKVLGDGGTITLVNERRIARDSKGRIYQERWLLVPKEGKEQSEMSAIQISDPAAHTLYTCLIQETPRQCVLTAYSQPPDAVYRELSPPSGDLPKGRGSTVHEELGTRFVGGVETHGVRDTAVYNSGVFGNDRPLKVEREFWYSPQLSVNLLSMRSDPRFGKETFTVSTVLVGEPDPKLFELPEGFVVVDHRPNTPPQGP